MTGKSFDGEQSPEKLNLEVVPRILCHAGKSTVGGDNEREKGVAERKLAVVIDATWYKANEVE